MANRQNFGRALRFEIAKRATRPDGQMACELCGAVGVRLELHHLDMDAMRADDDKRERKLTAADGAFWCLPCHKPETARQRLVLAHVDAARERHVGTKRAKGSIPSRPSAREQRQRDPQPLKIAAGPTAFMRQLRFGEDA